MRLSGSERIYSVRKKAGHSEAEEEIVSAAAEHSASGGTSAPESSLYRRIHLLIWSLFFFSFSVGFLIFMADMAPNIKRKLWVLFATCLILFPSSLVCWLQAPVLIVLLLEIIPSSWLLANMHFLVLLGAFFLLFLLKSQHQDYCGTYIKQDMGQHLGPALCLLRELTSEPAEPPLSLPACPGSNVTCRIFPIPFIVGLLSCLPHKTQYFSY